MNIFRRIAGSNAPLILASFAALAVTSYAADPAMPWIAVTPDNTGFVHAGTTEGFTPWGFNYDHDESNRLIEDYWAAEWSKVEQDFAEMKALGANVVRIHLQFGRFMTSMDTSNAQNLERLQRLVYLAERLGLYLNLTGLGCYHRSDTPAWYDALDESGRWNAQAKFWEAVASLCASSPAIFCYDLMNEPVVPGGRREPGDWLGPPFGDKSFVQHIALDQAGRDRPDIAVAWIRTLTAAIRKHDTRRLITVGLVPWSLDRPNQLTSGFVPERVAPELDFLSVHIYPNRANLDDAFDTLSGFAVGKPVVIEEMFPLQCLPSDLRAFIERSTKHASGWFGFYWGRTPDEFRQQPKRTIAESLTLGWLESFQAGPPNQ